MKQYLTQYEKELLEHVRNLEDHIQQRNEYLIKANGYAPGDPIPFNSEPVDRTTFSMRVLSKEKISAKLGFIRPMYTTRKQISEGHRPRQAFIGFYLKADKSNGRYGWEYEQWISIEDAQKVKRLLGKTVKGEIHEINRGEEVKITNHGLEGIKLPMFLFEEVKPANNPELIY